MNLAATNLLAVAVGGALGSTLRYLLGAGIHSVLGRDFPYGTLIVNIMGSLVIGYLLVLIPEVEGESPWLRLFLVTGLLGGFTTYSAFSLETLQLVHDGQFARAALNIGLTVVLCLAAVWLGWMLSRGLHGSG